MAQNKHEALALGDQPPPYGADVGVPPRRTIVDIMYFKGRPDDDVSEWLVRWEVAERAN